MRKRKLGFIGTGGRSVTYGRLYARREDVEIVALADPVPQHRRTMARAADLQNPFEEYDDWRQMHDARPDLDAVVICSPNHTHAEQSIAFLKRGLPILLEKPIAITKADCEQIVLAERNHGGRALIGFTLRSSPFYSTIHRLLAGGAIGQVYSIQADELIGWGVTSIINRNLYKRYCKTYGSVILSKCCHDLDILNWMMGCRPAAVSSFGGRAIFNPNPALPDSCDKCGVAANCKYYKEPPMAAQENPDDKAAFGFMRDNNLCIYNIDKDVIDNQMVSIEYESGALANFTMTMNCAGPRAGRNFHAVGRAGRIWGEFATGQVYHYDNATDQVAVHDTKAEAAGHFGGDRILAEELVKMLDDPAYRPIQSVEAGYVSAVACFAAEISRRERRRVEITYREDGLADFE